MVTRAGRRIALDSMRSTMVLLLAYFTAGLPVIYCHPAASAPLSSAKQVAGAKAAVKRMSQAKTPAQMAQCLTNESAAMMGTILVIPLMMQHSLPDTGASSRQKKAERARFEALLKRYGLDKAQNKGPESKEWRRFAAQGRRFLVEVDGFLARSGKGGQWKKTRRRLLPTRFRYTVLGPTRVAIRDPKKPKDPPMQARLEEGQWRLHLPLDAR
jgi:hypothetical protein